MTTTTQAEYLMGLRDNLRELEARVARCERMGDARRAQDYRELAEDLRRTLALMTEGN